MPSIYLATSNPDKFNFLSGQFSRANDANDADFIVVDLVEAVDLAKASWIRKAPVKEFVLTALNSNVGDPTVAANRKFLDFRSICRDQDEVFGELEHCKQNRDTLTALALAALKRGGS